MQKKRKILIGMCFVSLGCSGISPNPSREQALGAIDSSLLEPMSTAALEGVKGLHFRDMYADLLDRATDSEVMVAGYKFAGLHSYLISTASAYDDLDEMFTDLRQAAEEMGVKAGMAISAADVQADLQAISESLAEVDKNKELGLVLLPIGAVARRANGLADRSPALAEDRITATANGGFSFRASDGNTITFTQTVGQRGTVGIPTPEGTIYLTPDAFRAYLQIPHGAPIAGSNSDNAVSAEQALFLSTFAKPHGGG